MKSLKLLLIVGFLIGFPIKVQAIAGPSFPWPLQQIVLAWIDLVTWWERNEVWIYKAPGASEDIQENRLNYRRNPENDEERIVE